MDLGLFRIGVALKQYRKEKSLTLSDLAEKTGLECSTLSAIENGRFDGDIGDLLTYIHVASLEITCVRRDQSFPQLHVQDSFRAEKYLNNPPLLAPKILTSPCADKHFIHKVDTQTIKQYLVYIECGLVGTIEFTTKGLVVTNLCPRVSSEYSEGRTLLSDNDVRNQFRFPFFGSLDLERDCLRIGFELDEDDVLATAAITLEPLNEKLQVLASEQVDLKPIYIPSSFSKQESSSIVNDVKPRLLVLDVDNTLLSTHAYDANGNRTSRTSTELGVNAQAASYNTGDQLQTQSNTIFDSIGISVATELAWRIKETYTAASCKLKCQAKCVLLFIGAKATGDVINNIAEKTVNSFKLEAKSLARKWLLRAMPGVGWVSTAYAAGESINCQIICWEI
ncbi:helix-turn-helix domain-containing protein [Gilvimarinus chinensis]|uniref:helix-turn-helix domain-containing protein n=1 Tax=Gilvimarinus chinensis TaxID=396005 RepID=UPI000377AF73|nr:helix-turn-helix domain-containing protein [Gilvimarinus chinensis]